MISPRWETYRVEKTVKKLLEQSATRAGISGADWAGRIDLALASGSKLLILEFMRPGLKVDWDHIERFEKYIRILRTSISANTGGRFKKVTGYVVADQLDRDPVVMSKIEAMSDEDMFAVDWPTLFSNALSA